MILRKMKGLVSMLLIISIVLSTILVTNGETLEETVLSETADLIADEPSPGPVPQNILYAYAETEQPPFIFGDLNGDNKVNSTDYSLLKRFLLEIVENFTSPYGLTAADLNLDSRVNSTDYTIMKRYLLELVDQLPFTNKTNSVIAAANYAELRDRLSEEVKKKVEIVVATYSGVTDSLDQNVVAIVNDILGQTGISGTVNSSSFRIEGKTGSMAIIFSFEYNQSSITDLEQLKESIRAGMKEFQTTVEIPIGTNVNEVTQSLGEIIESILSEEEYLNRKCKSYSANLRSNGDAYNLILNFEYYTTKEQEDELTEKIKEILSVIIKPNMDDDQKEKEIHDYIVSRIKYDYEFKNRTAYDALMTGKVTCDGYSELTLRMLGEAGIESKIVTSSDHAWNLVRIGDRWFHVDCTWNAGIYEQTKEIVYNYYNLTDKEMSRYHSWNTGNYPPSNINYTDILKLKNMDKYAFLLREINKRKEQGIFFYINKIKIHPYSTKQLSYRAVLDSADDKISWSSSNNNIVTVQDGIITSAGVGTAVITAVGGDKYTASCIVEVVSDTEVIEDPTGITFEEKQINMDVRETRSLVYYAIPERDYPGTITWISSNPYVVSVKDGYVTAFCEGTAEIMALMDGNYYDICQVTVSRKTPLDTSKMSSKVLSQELLSDVIREDNAAKPQITIFAEEDVNQTTKVVNKYGTFKTVAGLVGHAIDIETTSEFAWADISFTISEDALELNKFEDLTVAWYDPVTDSIIPVETQSNTADRILSARVTHFSTYMVINKWVLNKLKDQCTNVMDLYDSKRADVVFILDNKWSESLENVKLNMIKSVEDLDNSLDLNVNLMVINPNGSITNYGWYTNKGKPKYAPDYTDIEKFESMKTLRQLKEDISSIVSYGYSESNYHDGFVTEGSEIFTKAYNQASNLSGFRSKASRYIFGFSEIRAAGFFRAVKNSIMIKDNETYAFIQRNANYIFSKYSSVEGQVGIFNNFSEPISNYIIDTAKESITVFSTAAKLITDSWSTYRRTMGSNIHYFKVINDRYLNLYGICFIDVAAYLAKAAEDEVNTLDLVLEYHILRMEDGKYKFVVKSGDSLSSVSKIVNGNSKHWPIIQQENNLTSTVIRPGQILDVTRVINDEKIAMAVAEKLATIDELSKYLELTEQNVPGDIEVYNAKEMLEDISKDKKALFNTGNAVPVMDVRNSDGSIDGIWDDKFMDEIDAFLEAMNLKEVYYELQTEEERRMMVLHWIKMEKERKSLYYYPAPKAWYENMPEIPKTDSTYGKITAENKYYCKEVKSYYMRYIYPVEKVMGGDWWKPGINMFSVWAKMMYGVTSDEKGGLVVGTLEGLLIDYPTELVAGVFQVIYEVLNDPKQTLESIKFLVRALDPINGGDERDILVTLFVESMKAGIEEFIEGDEYEKGKIIGKYLCDIVTCFIGVVKGVKAGAQLVKELKNAGSLSKLIRAGLNKTAGNLKNSADEIARSIKAAGEAISKAKSMATSFRSSIASGLFKKLDGVTKWETATISVVVDKTNPSIVGKAGSKIYEYNPSILDNAIVKGSQVEYINYYKHLLTDAGIDEVVAANPAKFVGKDISAIKTEMGKLRARIQNAKDMAEDFALAHPEVNMTAIDGSYSFEWWTVENCAEIWAARDAILQGAKLENLAIRSIDYGTGAFKDYCTNCVNTFVDLIKVED